MRLIDADALDFCFPMTDDFNSTLKQIGIEMAKARVVNAPTIESEPVRHGKIIETIENGKMKRVFSCCNTDFTQLTMWITPNYCPNCGAKMEVDGDD